ncbi:MAG: DNA polymerase Y family protein [Candidatus Limnocylindria bacterium]
MTRLLALVWPALRVPEADTAAFGPMLDALDDLSPRVEAVDAGVALVDVTGLGPMHGGGDERRLAARAVALTRAVARARGVAPLPVRCGVGDNRWLAVLAARLARFERPDAPAAFRALAREELGDLPLTLLPADPATRQRFALFGLTSMGQLADLPRSAVGAQFGPAGERLQALARGHDSRPLVPRRRPERIVTQATFEPPLDGVGAAALALRRACAELCDQLRARHLAPGRAIVTLRLEDAPPLRVAQPFPQPALEPDWIARLLLSRIEAAACARGNAQIPPDSNLVAVRRTPGPARPHRSQPNLSRSASSGLSRGSTELESSRNSNTIARWQEPVREPRVTAIELSFDRLSDPAAHQLPAFEARAGRWEELRWSLERIRHRFGPGRLWRASVERPSAALPEHRSRLVDIGP